MLDLPLVLDLLRAVPTGCRLVLLGDENQLPSVGLGAVLAALSRPTALDKETAEKLEVYLPNHGFEIQRAATGFIAKQCQIDVQPPFWCRQRYRLFGKGGGFRGKANCGRTV